MKHVTLGLVLFVVWLLWSGYWPGLDDSGGMLTGLGAISCLTVVLIVRRMAIVDRESVPTEVSLRTLFYVPWLFWEIVKANIDVARRILQPRLPIQPHVVHLRTGQRTELGRVIYANSITLTPGTVTIGVQGDELTIHALTHEAAESLKTGEMDRRVTSIEGRS